ncbi:hypothetical protein V6N11_083409 [Hibiscus sabdariffa]|uniref:Uncharacterized protein n=1 Tax=Hibiscus sabdariffa TaxID=183260 RepID=A0ABR2QM66_9ROSI
MCSFHQSISLGVQGKLCHAMLEIGPGHKLAAASLSADVCKMCNSDRETVTHALRDCVKAKELLVLGAIDQHVVNETPNTFVDYGRTLVADSNTVQASDSSHAPLNRSTRWNCPMHAVINVNVDGAFVSATGLASVGAVARDHHSMVIAGIARKHFWQDFPLRLRGVGTRLLLRVMQSPL